MKRPIQDKRTRTAFTLIELLIAVVAFSIVLAAINAVFYSALKLRNTTSDKIDRALPLDRAFEIMRRDIAGMLPPGGTLSGELQTAAVSSSSGRSLGSAGVGSSGSMGSLGSFGIAGIAASPEFVTSTGRMDEYLPWPSVQKVAYHLVESANREEEGQDLVRVVTRNLLAETQEELSYEWLLSGVQAFGFLFYDGYQWREDWDSATEDPKLPRAVKVQITLVQPGQALWTVGEAPLELVVPLMAQGRTNQTAGAAQSGGGGG